MTGLPHMPRRYVFWQPIPSIHQIPFLESLAISSRSPVVYAYAEDMPAEKVALGWSLPSSTIVDMRSVNAKQADSLFAGDDKLTLHVFSGFHCHPALDRCFQKALSIPLRTAIISESYDPRGLRGILRRVRSMLDARRYGRPIEALFAMGDLGVRWFQTAGFPPEKVFPFAYAVAPPKPEQRVAESGRPYQLVFVGRLVHLKGIDLLLRALASATRLSWGLVIIGEGPLRKPLQKLAERLGIASRINWLGAVPNSRVADVVSASDLLVLPSRKDGWGAVVNESLSVGTPVVCSSACGAADLVSDPTMGQIFVAGDIQALAGILRQRIAAGLLPMETRREITSRSSVFSPPAVAKYFLDVLQAVNESMGPPPVPWRNPRRLS